MRVITKEDALKLQSEFLEYTERTEQAQYPMLALIHLKLIMTIENFEMHPNEELNAMFRVVYRIIGKDFNEYAVDNRG